MSAILTIAPFFAIFIYYKNFDTVIFVHASFLLLIIAIRELTKDLENMTGDLALNYRTVPVVYGEQTSKIMITFLLILALIPLYLLVNKFKIGHMSYYFYGAVILLVFFLILLWKSSTKTHYIILHNILKVIIVTGVFSILLIDVDLVLKRIL